MCAFRLVLHPSTFTGDRFSEDQERAVIDEARRSANVVFPIEGPERGANLDDGFEVHTTLLRDGSRPEYREYYRFRRDGLFVLVRASPDDIDEHRQYRDSDRYIGFATLVATLTKMAAFAAALTKACADDTTATICVSGLANHILVDDTADHALTLGTLQVSHQERIVSEFAGSSGQFQEGWREWAVEAIAKCLRALNYPENSEVTKATVRNFQQLVR
jgi:hypothetical protein